MASMGRCQSWCVQTGLLQPSIAAALGVIQIIVARFYLGLGPRQIFNFPVDSTDMGATFWLGVVYLTAGVLVVVAGLSLSVWLSLLTATYITMTVLAGLQLCVCITLVVLGIKMFNGTKQGDKSAPLLPTEDLSYDVM